MNKTNGFSTRMGEAKLSLGMKRFADGDDNPLWRLLVSEYPTSQVVMTVDAEMRVLVAIRRFADEAITAIETDGGRNVPAVARAS